MACLKTATRRVTRSLAWLLAGSLTILGYGIDAEDKRVLAEFRTAVHHWQAGPDFRQVAYEYVRTSHAAMNATPWGLTATTWIMAIRSVPGLPPEYAVSPTSAAHYDNFTRGELSAYLHLCGEQTMGWVIGDLHGIASAGAPDAEIKRFLDSWKMNRKVASDAAAIAGVRRLLLDIDAARDMPRPPHVQAELETLAETLASEMGFPPDHKQMTRKQQRLLFDRFDAAVRQRNPGLWRLKQVSDLCSGIWAQTFGMDYVMVIGPVLWAREVARVAGPIGVACLVLTQRRRRRRARG